MAELKTSLGCIARERCQALSFREQICLLRSSSCTAAINVLVALHWTGSHPVPGVHVVHIQAAAAARAPSLSAAPGPGPTSRADACTLRPGALTTD